MCKAKCTKRHVRPEKEGVYQVNKREGIVDKRHQTVSREKIMSFLRTGDYEVDELVRNNCVWKVKK